jgi:UTP--glucose-1-phosphate uridylyltransferase
MMDIYEQSKTSVIAVQEVPWEDVSKYGIVSPASSLDKYQLIEDLVEKPDRDQAPSNLAVIGRYIIMPEIFGILERQEPGRGGEIQLTDALRVLNRQQQMAAYLMQAKRYDVGDKMGYIEATIELALQRPDLQDQVKAYLLSLIRQLELK